MEWRKGYLDLMLVPLGFAATVIYHVYLWHKVRTQPYSTIIGTNAAGRRLWVSSMIKDNDKKNILAVQTLRNAIMGSTLMATTSILLSTGLAAVISSTYSVKKPLNETIYGAHGEFMTALKYVSLLLILLFAFLCYSLSIRFINQVNFLINSPQDHTISSMVNTQYVSEHTISSMVNTQYVSEMLERGFVLNTVGNRLFYAALPLLLWIFGPILVFLCYMTMIPILYNLDFVMSRHSSGSSSNEEMNKRRKMEDIL